MTQVGGKFIRKSGCRIKARITSRLVIKTTTSQKIQMVRRIAES